MPMKYWRPSVRNKIIDLRLLLLFVVAVTLAFASACQRAQLAEYRAYSGDADVPRISLEEAKRDYDNGFAVIVDSRDAGSFANEHIKGAINIPVGSPETEYSKIPQGKKIIVYCS